MLLILVASPPQVWDMLLFYMNTLSERTSSRYEALRFLFRLAFMTVGPGYPVRDLTAAQRDILLDLADMGLVFMPDNAIKALRAAAGGGAVNMEAELYFYPTRLATYLSMASHPYPSSLQRVKGSPTAVAVAAATLSDPDAAATNERFLMVETTLKVYGFTSSPYQIALLSFFVELKHRLPNMVVGFITRRSIRRALLNGIPVERVVGWLEQHAHARMVHNALGTPDSTGRLIGGTDFVIPTNVTDQMKLWSEERNRLTGEDAVLVTEFKDEAEFKRWYTFALERKFILYVDHEKWLLVVTPDGLAAMKEHQRKTVQQASQVHI
jgi:transcription initiation factor TFIIH subunit 4